jgi:ADP-ribose pyrophosphatase YjhB (NUDIX family)
MATSLSSAKEALAAVEALYEELAEVHAEVAFVEDGDFNDPTEFASAVINNLPAIAYALNSGLPVTAWGPLSKNPAENERIMRAMRQWSEQARLLIERLAAGTISLDQFYNDLIANYRRQSMNAYMAGRRSVGNLGPLDQPAVDRYQSLIKDDVTRLQQQQVQTGNVPIVTAGAAGAGGAAGGGLGQIVSSMLQPVNFIGSGLPGDPLNVLMPGNALMGAGGAEAAANAFSQRVEQYGRSIGSMASAGEMSALADLPEEVVIVWWELGPSDHCEDCIQLADLSPFNLQVLDDNGLFPGSGHTRCGSNCACDLSYDVPTEVCGDTLLDNGVVDDIGEAGGEARPFPFLPSNDGTRLNVWVQEADSCEMPLDIASSFPAGEDLEIIGDEDAFSWDEDLAAQMDGDLEETALDLEAAIEAGGETAAAVGWLPEYLGVQAAAEQVSTIFLKAEKVTYKFAWRETPTSVVFDYGRTISGAGTLDPEMTMAALRQLADYAAKAKKDLLVNAETAGPGMRKWFDSLATDRLTSGAAVPSVVPKWDFIPPPMAARVPEAPTFRLPEVSALPTVDVSHIEHLVPEVAPVGGMTPKSVIIDAKGDRFMVKHTRASEDVAATRIADDMGLRVVPARPFEATSGVAEGAAQPMLPKVKTLDEKIKPEVVFNSLTPEQAREVNAQSVLDYVLANNDAHPGQFLIDTEGRIWGIDKALSFRDIANPEMAGANFWLKEPGGSALGYPGVLYGEALRHPETSRILDLVHPEDVTAALDRLNDYGADAIVARAKDAGALQRVAVNRARGEYLGEDAAERVLRERVDGARAAYDDMYQQVVAGMGDKAPDDWKAWLATQPGYEPGFTDAERAAVKFWRDDGDLAIGKALRAGETLPAVAGLDSAIAKAPSAVDRTLKRGVTKREWEAGLGSLKDGESITVSNFIATAGEDGTKYAAPRTNIEIHVAAGTPVLDLQGFDKSWDWEQEYLLPRGGTLTRTGTIDGVAQFRYSLPEVEAVVAPVAALPTMADLKAMIGALPEGKQNTLKSIRSAYRKESVAKLGVPENAPMEDWLLAAYSKIADPGYAPGTLSYDKGLWRTLTGTDPEWAGAVAKPIPTPAPTAVIATLPSAPMGTPLPAMMRATATDTSSVGTNRAVWAVGFKPAPTREQAVERLTDLLGTKSHLDEFNLPQLNAMLARAETLDSMGFDLSRVKRLDDFSHVHGVPKDEVGLTKGDVIAIRHDNKWAYFGTEQATQHPTVYEDLGGALAHEYGHVLLGQASKETRAAILKIRDAHPDVYLSDYAKKDAEEWFGEVVAKITEPGYKPGTVSYDGEIYGLLQKDHLLKQPVALEPKGPPIVLDKPSNGIKPGDPQQYLVGESPLPVNAPLAEWSGFVPPEPGLPKEVLKADKAELAAKKAAADEASKSWKDVAPGKVEVALSRTQAETDEALKAGLVYRNVKGTRLIGKDTHALDQAEAWLSEPGRSANSDAFWQEILGYSDKDLDAIDAFADAQKGKRLTSGVVMVEPDGRVWVLSPKNEFAGYQNTWIKGGVDEGESTAQAAVREMREEAGFSVEIDSYLGDYMNTDKTGIARMYIGHRTGGGPLGAHLKETYKVRLLDGEEAKKLLTRYGKPDARDQTILADALKAINGEAPITHFVIGKDEVGNFATMLKPKPVLEPKPIYGWNQPTLFAVNPKPVALPTSATFGFDKSYIDGMATHVVDQPPSSTKFPFSTSKWSMPDGQIQPMYWKVEAGKTYEVETIAAEKAVAAAPEPALGKAAAIEATPPYPPLPTGYKPEKVALKPDVQAVADGLSAVYKDVADLPERKAFAEYRKHGYGPVNDLLRGETVDEHYMTLAHAKELVGDLDRLVGEAPLPQPVILYRDLKSPAAFGLPKDASLADVKALIGKDVTEPGFMSTTLNPSMWDYQVKLEIRAPQGTPAYFKGGTGESEVLLGRGQTYRISDVYERTVTDKWGTKTQTVVRVDIVPSEALTTAAKAAEPFTPVAAYTGGAVAKDTEMSAAKGPKWYHALQDQHGGQYMITDLTGKIGTEGAMDAEARVGGAAIQRALGVKSPDAKIWQTKHWAVDASDPATAIVKKDIFGQRLIPNAQDLNEIGKGAGEAQERSAVKALTADQTQQVTKAEITNWFIGEGDNNFSNFMVDAYGDIWSIDHGAALSKGNLGADFGFGEGTPLGTLAIYAPKKLLTDLRPEDLTPIVQSIAHMDDATLLALAGPLTPEAKASLLLRRDEVVERISKPFADLVDSTPGASKEWKEWRAAGGTFGEPKAVVAAAPEAVSATKPGLDEAIARVAEVKPISGESPFDWDALLEHAYPNETGKPGAIFMQDAVPGGAIKNVVIYGDDGKAAAIAEIALPGPKDPTGHVITVRTRDDLHGKGWATRLYDQIQDTTDINLYPAVARGNTDEGKGFVTAWLKHRQALETAAPAEGKATAAVVPAHPLESVFHGTGVTSAEKYGVTPVVPDGSMSTAKIKTMTVYHVTTVDAAESILANGFDPKFFTSQWLNDYAVSATKGSLTKARDYFGIKPETGMMGTKKGKQLVVLQLEVKGRVADDAASDVATHFPHGAIDYATQMKKAGWDIEDHGPVQYIYNLDSIVSVKAVGPEAEMLIKSAKETAAEEAKIAKAAADAKVAKAAEPLSQIDATMAQVAAKGGGSIVNPEDWESFGSEFGEKWLGTPNTGIKITQPRPDGEGTYDLYGWYDGTGELVAIQSVIPNYVVKDLFGVEGEIIPTYFDALIVRPGATNKGYGTQLLDWMQAETEANPIANIATTVGFTDQGYAFTLKWLEHQKGLAQGVHTAAPGQVAADAVIHKQVTGQIFWANSKTQVADPHLRYNLHVAQLRKLLEKMDADSIGTLKVNDTLLDQVPQLRDLLMAAGGEHVGNTVELGFTDAKALLTSLTTDAPLPKAAGYVKTAALAPEAVHVSAAGANVDMLGTLFDNAKITKEPASASMPHEIEWSLPGGATAHTTWYYAASGQTVWIMGDLTHLPVDVAEQIVAANLLVVKRAAKMHPDMAMTKDVALDAKLGGVPLLTKVDDLIFTGSDGVSFIGLDKAIAFDDETTTLLGMANKGQSGDVLKHDWSVLPSAPPPPVVTPTDLAAAYHYQQNIVAAVKSTGDSKMVEGGVVFRERVMHETQTGGSWATRWAEGEKVGEVAKFFSTGSTVTGRTEFAVAQIRYMGDLAEINPAWDTVRWSADALSGMGKDARAMLWDAGATQKADASWTLTRDQMMAVRDQIDVGLPHTMYEAIPPGPLPDALGYNPASLKTTMDGVWTGTNLTTLSTVNVPLAGGGSVKGLWRIDEAGRTRIEVVEFDQATDIQKTLGMLSILGHDWLVDAPEVWIANKNVPSTVRKLLVSRGAKIKADRIVIGKEDLAAIRADLLPAPAASAALSATMPATVESFVGEEVAKAAEAVVGAQGASSKILSLLEGATDLKSTWGTTAVTNTWYDGRKIAWRRLGNVLEIHGAGNNVGVGAFAGVEEDVWAAHILRMAKSMEAAPKIDALRLTNDAINWTPASITDLLENAGGKYYSGGLRLSREQVFAVRDQIMAEAAKPVEMLPEAKAIAEAIPTPLLDSLDIEPDIMATLQAVIVPQKQGFVKHVYDLPEGQASVRVRYQSTRMTWTGVSADDPIGEFVASVARLRDMGPEFLAHPEWGDLRILDPSTLHSDFKALLDDHGGYPFGDTYYVPRQHVIAMSDTLTQESAAGGSLGHAITAATSAPEAATGPDLLMLAGVSPDAMKAHAIVMPEIEVDAYSGTVHTIVYAPMPIDQMGYVRHLVDGGVVCNATSSSTISMHLDVLRRATEMAPGEEVRIGLNMVSGLGDDVTKAMIAAGGSMSDGKLILSPDLAATVNKALTDALPLPVMVDPAVVAPTAADLGATLKGQMGFTAADVHSVYMSKAYFQNSGTAQTIQCGAHDLLFATSGSPSAEILGVMAVDANATAVELLAGLSAVHNGIESGALTKNSGVFWIAYTGDDPAVKSLIDMITTATPAASIGQTTTDNLARVIAKVNSDKPLGHTLKASAAEVAMPDNAPVLIDVIGHPMSDPSDWASAITAQHGTSGPLASDATTAAVPRTTTWPQSGVESHFDVVDANWAGGGAFPLWSSIVWKDLASAEQMTAEDWAKYALAGYHDLAVKLENGAFYADIETVTIDNLLGYTVPEAKQIALAFGGVENLAGDVVLKRDQLIEIGHSISDQIVNVTPGTAAVPVITQAVPLGGGWSEHIVDWVADTTEGPLGVKAGWGGTGWWKHIGNTSTGHQMKYSWTPESNGRTYLNSLLSDSATIATGQVYKDAVGKALIDVATHADSIKTDLYLAADVVDSAGQDLMNMVVFHGGAKAFDSDWYVLDVDSVASLMEDIKKAGMTPNPLGMAEPVVKTRTGLSYAASDVGSIGAENLTIQGTATSSTVTKFTMTQDGMPCVDLTIAENPNAIWVMAIDEATSDAAVIAAVAKAGDIAYAKGKHLGVVDLDEFPGLKTMLKDAGMTKLGTASHASSDPASVIDALMKAGTGPSTAAPAATQHELVKAMFPDGSLSPHLDAGINDSLTALVWTEQAQGFAKAEFGYGWSVKVRQSGTSLTVKQASGYGGPAQTLSALIAIGDRVEKGYIPLVKLEKPFLDKSAGAAEILQKYSDMTGKGWAPALDGSWTIPGTGMADLRDAIKSDMAGTTWAPVVAPTTTIGAPTTSAADLIAGIADGSHADAIALTDNWLGEEVTALDGEAQVLAHPVIATSPDNISIFDVNWADGITAEQKQAMLLAYGQAAEKNGKGFWIPKAVAEDPDVAPLLQFNLYFPVSDDSMQKVLEPSTLSIILPTPPAAPSVQSYLSTLSLPLTMDSKLSFDAGWGEVFVKVAPTGNLTLTNPVFKMAVTAEQQDAMLTAAAIYASSKTKGGILYVGDEVAAHSPTLKAAIEGPAGVIYQSELKNTACNADKLHDALLAASPAPTPVPGAAGALPWDPSVVSTWNQFGPTATLYASDTGMSDIVQNVNGKWVAWHMTNSTHVEGVLPGVTEYDDIMIWTKIANAPGVTPTTSPITAVATVLASYKDEVAEGAEPVWLFSKQFIDETPGLGKLLRPYADTILDDGSIYMQGENTKALVTDIVAGKPKGGLVAAAPTPAAGAVPPDLAVWMNKMDFSGQGPMKVDLPDGSFGQIVVFVNSPTHMVINTSSNYANIPDAGIAAAALKVVSEPGFTDVGHLTVAEVFPDLSPTLKAALEKAGATHYGGKGSPWEVDAKALKDALETPTGGVTIAAPPKALHEQVDWDISGVGSIDAKPGDWSYEKKSRTLSWTDTAAPSGVYSSITVNEPIKQIRLRYRAYAKRIILDEDLTYYGGTVAQHAAARWKTIEYLAQKAADQNIPFQVSAGMYVSDPAMVKLLDLYHAGPEETTALFGTGRAFTAAQAKQLADDIAGNVMVPGTIHVATAATPAAAVKTAEQIAKEAHKAFLDANLIEEQDIGSLWWSSSTTARCSAPRSTRSAAPRPRRWAGRSTKPGCTSSRCRRRAR